jgi:ABC-type polar amino acid transport system ATPase subunit
VCFKKCRCRAKILITGRSGSGKSTYFTRLVLQSRYHYRFVFDHEAEFQQRTKYPAATSAAELSEQLAGRRLVIFDPAELFPGRTPEAFQISQAPNLIHNRVRNSLTECVTFVHNDENAIVFLEDVGFDPERIRNLSPGEFIARSLVDGTEDRGKVF